MKLSAELKGAQMTSFTPRHPITANHSPNSGSFTPPFAGGLSPKLPTAAGHTHYYTFDPLYHGPSSRRRLPLTRSSLHPATFPTTMGSQRITDWANVPHGYRGRIYRLAPLGTSLCALPYLSPEFRIFVSLICYLGTFHQSQAAGFFLGRLKFAVSVR